MTIQIETEAGLILPGHPFFNDWLYATLPPSWRDFAFHNPDFCFVAREGSGLLEAVSEKDMEEYVEGGEYDLVLENQIDENDDY